LKIDCVPVLNPSLQERNRGEMTQLSYQKTSKLPKRLDLFFKPELFKKQNEKEATI
jgi:hypothetical protein